jgi:hypothetical protein
MSAEDMNWAKNSFPHWFEAQKNQYVEIIPVKEPFQMLKEIIRSLLGYNDPEARYKARYK